MKAWFDLSETDRTEIIIQTSAEVGLPPAAVEKDFWVTMVLNAVFNTDNAEDLVFKGGTSLSKAWKIIERFSEDIDLAIDRKLFGFDGQLSSSQIRKLRKVACKFISEEFIVKLENSLIQLGIREFDISVHQFEASDTDPISIEVSYKSITEKKNYLKPRVVVEISARSLREPFELREIKSMIGEKYSSHPFADLGVMIPTVLPTRTFLEKIFLLHEEFQKPKGKKNNSTRMTRHLYDLSKIMDTTFAKEALNDTELYNAIVQHRSTITKLNWVNYANHFPGQVNFIPPPEEMDKWEKDYEDMQESMFYGTTEKYGDLIRKLETLKNSINSSDLQKLP